VQACPTAPVPADADDIVTDRPPIDTGPDAPDATLDVAADAATDSVGDAPPDALADAARGVGWIRFVHVAPGVGTVRFVATNAPLYDFDRVEAVVDEGTTSAYVPALPVPHIVRVEQVGVADAGAIPIAFQTDVYNNAGCSVALLGTLDAPDGGDDALRIVRITDLPFRADAGQALLRAFHAVAGAPLMTFGADDASYWVGIPYSEITGLLETASGARTFQIDFADAALPGSPLTTTLADREAQSLFVYGRAYADGAVPLRVLRTNDIPPDL